MIIFYFSLGLFLFDLDTQTRTWELLSSWIFDCVCVCVFFFFFEIGKTSIITRFMYDHFDATYQVQFFCFFLIVVVKFAWVFRKKKKKRSWCKMFCSYFDMLKTFRCLLVNSFFKPVMFQFSFFSLFKKKKKKRPLSALISYQKQCTLKIE